MAKVALSPDARVSLAGAVSPTGRNMNVQKTIGRAGNAVGAAVDASLNLTLAGLGIGTAGLRYLCVCVCVCVCHARFPSPLPHLPTYKANIRRGHTGRSGKLRPVCVYLCVCVCVYTVLRSRPRCPPT